MYVHRLSLAGVCIAFYQHPSVQEVSLLPEVSGPNLIVRNAV